MKQTVIMLFMALVGMSANAQSKPSKSDIFQAETVIMLPNGHQSYLTADSCWHITDTIATLNVILNLLHHDWRDDQIKRLQEIIDAKEKRDEFLTDIHVKDCDIILAQKEIIERYRSGQIDTLKHALTRDTTELDSSPHVAILNSGGTFSGTPSLLVDSSRQDDITVNGITFHHSANCSNCDLVTAMMIAGYNYNNGVFTKGDGLIVHKKRTLKHKVKHMKRLPDGSFYLKELKPGETATFSVPIIIPKKKKPSNLKSI